MAGDTRGRAKGSSNYDPARLERIAAALRARVQAGRVGKRGFCKAERLQRKQQGGFTRREKNRTDQSILREIWPGT